MSQTIHNPDQYMSDLRQILAQGRKRLGLLLGAGAPASILVDKSTGNLKSDGVPLIAVTTEITQNVLKALSSKYGSVLNALVVDLGGNPNIEQILSRVRTLGEALGKSPVHDLDGPGFTQLGEAICNKIGKAVDVRLPTQPNAFSELAGWIGGTARDHAFEIFTPNYDLLIEEAFERAHIPYFDGFCGSFEPFFDPATIANNADLPPRWARLWKLHGSLGWDENLRGEIVRGKGTTATRCIFPTYQKYEQTQKLPYSAFFERLRKFLQLPDSLLMTCGFSFSDRHLVDVIDESLASNRAAAVIAFQFDSINLETTASRLASRRANMSVYARDGAVINCVEAKWQPGDLPHPQWAPIRTSYWRTSQSSNEPCFILGDFSAFARYVALTRAEQAPSVEPVVSREPTP
jgi:hypothetical protein